MVTEEQILEGLREIQDPDLGRDIVALGFIKNIVIEAGEVSLTIELTTPACPVKEDMKADAERIVSSLPGVESVRVSMTAQVRASLTPQELIPGVRHCIAIASGKGGVGKSTVACNLAVALAKTGATVGLLDADIYGPSIPTMMGVRREPDAVQTATGAKMVPIKAHGVSVMSLGFLLREDQVVVWRGPMLGKAVADMLSGVLWGTLDYLLIDLPPGTGDVPMSLAQLVPLSGVVVVTTPQEVAQEIARKSILMFSTLEKSLNRTIPILGVVENMSGGIFGTGGGERTASRHSVPFLGSIPLDEAISLGGDAGKPSALMGENSIEGGAFAKIAGAMAARVSVLQYSENSA